MPTKLLAVADDVLFGDKEPWIHAVVQLKKSVLYDGETVYQLTEIDHEHGKQVSATMSSAMVN